MMIVNSFTPDTIGRICGAIEKHCQRCVSWEARLKLAGRVLIVLKKLIRRHEMIPALYKLGGIKWIRHRN